jgi:hypothetical protein
LVSESHKSSAPDVEKAPRARRLFTYEHEASGEKKRTLFWVGADPKFTRTTQASFWTESSVVDL